MFRLHADARDFALAGRAQILKDRETSGRSGEVWWESHKWVVWACDATSFMFSAVLTPLCSKWAAVDHSKIRIFGSFETKKN